MQDLWDVICTWKHALCGALSGRVEPILLTTLRVDPWGLFCQIGITSCKAYLKNTVIVSAQNIIHPSQYLVHTFYTILWVNSSVKINSVKLRLHLQLGSKLTVSVSMVMVQSHPLESRTPTLGASSDWRWSSSVNRCHVSLTANSWDIN